MELQRGVCNLCSENGKVLTPSDAEEFSTCLPQILHENFLNVKEFQSIKDSIKICTICCFKVQTATEIKKTMQDVEEENADGTSNQRKCRFCNDDSNLVIVRADWKYFNERTEGYVKPKDFPIFVCPRCFFYFDATFTIKSKLSFKFPHLIRKNTPKQIDTPKRKSLSKSPPVSKKRKIFDNCFAYLQPLCNNNYQVADKLTRDKKLYRKIAYVDLQHSKDVEVKETPKMRPVIKIRLKKPRGKKDEYQAQPYVKLCQSEEIHVQVSSVKKKVRRHSFYEQKENYDDEENEKPEENIEETPKAASVANLVPKRRVSVYLAEAEASNEEQPASTEETPEEVPETVDKLVADSAINSEEEDKQELDEVQDNVDTNGIDKPASENGDDDAHEDSEPIEEMNNGKLPQEPVQVDNIQDNFDNEDSNLSHSSNSSAVSLNGSDPEVNNKSLDENNTEGDSLNGSERKKKRVTFSDEIN